MDKQDEPPPRFIHRESRLPDVIGAVGTLATGLWVTMREKSKILDKDVWELVQSGVKMLAPSGDGAPVADPNQFNKLSGLKIKFAGEIVDAITHPENPRDPLLELEKVNELASLKKISAGRPHEMNASQTKAFVNTLKRAINKKFPGSFGMSHLTADERFNILFKAVTVSLAVGAVVFYTSKILSQKGAVDENYYYIEKEKERRRQQKDASQESSRH